MKKILSLVLALALILSCMCLPASADVKYDVTLRVEVFDRSIAGLNLEDCWQLRYAQENFGDPNGIKLQFVPVSRWEEGDILTTQISGETAADAETEPAETEFDRTTVSDDLPEVVVNSSRVIVMKEGAIVGEMSGDDVTEKAIAEIIA